MFTEVDRLIAARQVKLTDRTGRTVSEVATELSRGWRAITDAVAAYGTALRAADTHRAGGVEALGLN